VIILRKKRVYAVLILFLATVSLSDAMGNEASGPPDSDNFVSVEGVVESNPQANERKFSLRANLAGAALWGLSTTFEWGSRAALEVRLRFPNLGVLPYEMAENLTYEDEYNDFKWGLGGAVGVRGYPLRGSVMNRLYIGALLEYYHVNGSREAYDWNQGFLIPQAEAGYRWTFKNFLVGVGLAGGGMLNVLNRREYWHGWEQDAALSDALLFIEANVEIGWIN
jgi:hypothetical protein